MAYSPGQEISSLAFDKIIGGALDAVVKAQNNSSLTTVNFIKSVGFVGGASGGNEKPVYVEFKYPKEVAPYIPAVKTYSIEIAEGGSKYTDGNVKFSINKKQIDVLPVIEDGVIKSASLVDPAQVEISVSTDITVEDTSKAAAADKGNGAKAKLIVQTKEAVNAKFQDMSLQVPLLTMMPIPFIRIATTDIEFNVKINSLNTSSTSEESNTNIESKTTAGYKSFWSPVNASTTFNASFSSQKKNSSSEEIKKEFSLVIKIHAVQDEMPAGVSRVLDILEESIISKPVISK